MDQFWSGEFGDSYTARNRVDWRARIPFWRYILDWTGARSVYEVGCNSGWNLSAIRRAYPDVAVAGSDINEMAISQAWAAGLQARVWAVENIGGQFEIAFTAGVLIHTAPDDLPAMMQRIVDASCHFVMAVEYYAPEETGIEYRGHADRLWKRPYGNLYERMGLELVDSGLAKGFDRCHFWLMERR